MHGQVLPAERLVEKREGLLVEVLEPRLGNGRGRPRIGVESDLRDRSAGRPPHASWGAWASSSRPCRARRAPSRPADRAWRRGRGRPAPIRSAQVLHRGGVLIVSPARKLHVALHVAQLAQDADPCVGRELDLFRRVVRLRGLDQPQASGRLEVVLIGGPGRLERLGQSAGQGEVMRRQRLLLRASSEGVACSRLSGSSPDPPARGPRVLPEHRKHVRHLVFISGLV